LDRYDKAAEWHARLKELFFRGVELDRESRRRFVAEACGDDIELRGELESLLDHHLQIEISEPSDTHNQ
jgi:hypothetical protein